MDEKSYLACIRLPKTLTKVCFHAILLYMGLTTILLMEQLSKAVPHKKRSKPVYDKVKCEIKHDDYTEVYCAECGYSTWKGIVIPINHKKTCSKS